MARGPGDGKEKLLAAASELFEHGGYDAVTVAMILEGAGVQPPTLYYHFKDKEGLFVAWAVDSLSKLEQPLNELTSARHTTLGALERGASTLLRLTRMDLLRLLRDCEALVRPESREEIMTAYLQAVYSPLCAVMVRGIHRGELRTEPIGAMVEWFLAGAFSLPRAYKGHDSMEEGCAWLAQKFIRGCGAQPIRAVD